jgi:amino acid adenylation domain-containing protein
MPLPLYRGQDNLALTQIRQCPPIVHWSEERDTAVNYLSKENVEEVLSLSPLQARLAAPPAGDAAGQHLAQATYRLEGIIDPSILQEACDHLIALHPTLRVVFRAVKSRIVQVVLKTRPIVLQTHDLRGMPAGERQGAIEAIMAADREHAFDLAEGPLLRLALIRLEDRQALLLWTHHEIILDHESRSLALADLTANYDAIAGGEPLPRTARRPYRDYLSWLARQDWTAATAFWATRSADASDTAARLPEEAGMDTRPPRVITRSLTLPAELSNALKGAAQAQGAGASTLLQTLWAVFLSFYTNEEHVLFGLECAGRPADLAGAEAMLGRFAAAMPLDVHVDGSLTVSTLLRDLQRNQAALMGYVPTTPSEARGPRITSDSVGAFDTFLAVHEDPDRRVEGAAISAECEQFMGGYPCGLAVDLSLGVRWRIVMSSSTYSPRMLDRFLIHFRSLLECFAGRPEARIADLTLLPNDERQRLLIEFNRTEPGAPLDRLFHQVITDQARRCPDAVAVVHGRQQLTYGDLNARANGLACRLRACGFGRDSLAALLTERGIDMLIAILAIAKAGGAYMPLDTAYPDARLTTLLGNSKATIILTQDHLAQRCRGLIATLPMPPKVVSLPAMAALADHPSFINHPRDLAYVFYTSGSTGQPKGAMIEHIGMLNHLWAKVRLLGLNDESVVIQNASHCFDISVWQMFAPLIVGGKVVICDDEQASDPRALLSLTQSSRATVLEVVPTMLEALLQNAAGSEPAASLLPDLRYLISTAEALPVPLCRKWFDAYPQVTMVNAYGPTECSDDTTHEIIAAAPIEEQANMPVGTVLPNFAVYILDRCLRLTPLGNVGEIYFAGIGVGRGYLDDPERTACSFIPNPFASDAGDRLYRTGDLGRFLPDGRLVYCGRLDGQVKIRGRRIELGEIEAVLVRHRSVRQGVVIARADAAGGQRILAYVVLAEDGSMADVRAHLAALLPGYMVPEHIVQLNALPLNRNGKVDRKQLPDVEGADRATPATAPRDEIEEGLVCIWQEVLSVARIGIDDCFFECGGHSLKTVQVRSRIQQQFGVDIALRTLFEQQTIRQLAPVIAHARAGTISAHAAAIPRQPTAEFYPMAHAQRRIWFLQQMDPDNCFYNLPSALELEGALNLATLHQAFATLLERQASLRTTFAVVDGQPVQRVAPTLEWSSPLEDLSALPAQLQAQAVSAALSADARTRFDLEAGPLFRVKLLRLAAEHHILLFTIHHIIGDAWSSAVLQREFAALYEAYCHGLPNPLPPLPIHYTDYAAWQNRRLAGDAPAVDERYWLTQLAGPLPVLDLPTDRRRPAIQTYGGATQELVLDPDLHARLDTLCRQSGTTLFMVLLAAVTAFLSRLTAQEDIIIGSPIAGRDRMELENLVGFFVNVLPFRIDLSGDPTFEQLLERVRKTALDAYAHQEYPFDNIVQKVNPARDLSRSPIFSVLFQVDNAAKDVSLDGVTARQYPVPQEHARFDLTIIFADREDGLTCRLEYNADLFEATTIDWMLQRLSTMLEGIVSSPTTRIDRLPLISAPERLLLEEWNATTLDYPRDTCIHQLIEAQAQRTPDAVAIRWGNERLTYADLNRRSNQVAHGLRTLGIGPEVLVGICMERTPALVVGLLGILKAGAAYLPLDPGYPTERLAYMLKDARVPALLTQRLLAAGLPAHDATMLYLESGGDLFAEESTENPLGGTHPSGLAYTIYTSGSTGKPKGVQITHGSVVNFLQAMSERPGLTAADTLLAVTSLSFDIAALELFLPLSVGAQLVIASREEAADGTHLAGLLEDVAATVLQATPSTWRLLLAAGWRNNGAVRMFCGGEALPVELAARLVAEGATLWNMYGPTETTIWSAVHPVTAVSDDGVPIGKPIANTRIYLLDHHLRAVPIGVPGELYIGGDGVARGYLHRPDLTAERFIPDPYSAQGGARLYRTGDLARYQSDGNIEYLGRLDDQVKVRGYRIELGEIEAVLMQHPAVREVVAMAREDTPGDVRLTAYVVPHTGEAPTAGDLRGYLVGKLPEYMVPAAFVPLDTLPLTLNGKVNRRELPVPGVAQLPQGRQYVAPTDPLEVAMTSLWEDVLQVRPVGLRDDFFEIGGHSMTAVMLVTAVRRAFAVNVPLTVLFQAPTVADLCAYLRADNRMASRIVTPIRVGGARPPLFLIHPQGGGVLCYLHLARTLEGSVPVYGVEAIGYDSDEPPLTAIDAMADCYVEEIRRCAPHGPYRLAGWSFGGLVAFEIVRRLEALGEEIDFLGLIDVYAFGQEGDAALFDVEDEGDSAENALIGIAVRQLGMNREDLKGIDEEQGIALVMERAKALNLMPPDAVADSIHRRIRMMTNNEGALRSYKYSGRIRSAIHLFRALEVQSGSHPAVEAEEWDRRTTGGVHIAALPGDHHTLLNPPHVFALAEQMNAILADERAPVCVGAPA